MSHIDHILGLAGPVTNGTHLRGDPHINTYSTTRRSPAQTNLTSLATSYHPLDLDRQLRTELHSPRSLTEPSSTRAFTQTPQAFLDQDVDGIGEGFDLEAMKVSGSHMRS
jgi:hypothetical protein